MENSVTLNLEQFKDTRDFHCVTTWSQFGLEWQGVSFFTIAELVQSKDSSTYVHFKGYDKYSVNTTLDAVMDNDGLTTYVEQ